MEPFLQVFLHPVVPIHGWHNAMDLPEIQGAGIGLEDWCRCSRRVTYTFPICHAHPREEGILGFPCGKLHPSTPFRRFY